MVAPLPLYPGAVPCVHSGFCCKRRPCSFGESVSAADAACKHLVEVQQDDGKQPRYFCGIYDHITSQKGWEIEPAFGAGCCSPLFNRDRARILREQ